VPRSSPTRRVVLAAGLAGLAVPLSGCSAFTGSATAVAPTPSEPATTGASTSVTTAGPPASPPATTTRAAGPDITHGPRTGTGVALTFHGAGDEALLKRMLAILADHDAHVTVLAIGQWLAAAPDQAKLILDGGHDLGNHTWSHPTMPRLAAAAVRTEIDRCSAELTTLTRTAGRWFRPSGTPSSNATIRAAAVTAGYGACLGYDLDPLDYTDPGAPAIERTVAAKVRPGSIVSLHLGHQGTLAAMPSILATLHTRNLRAVTATTLLGG
jgi:peptidoglycan/xylan/chitin deacetylase (PgdA/CDA1 family)